MRLLTSPSFLGNDYFYTMVLQSYTFDIYLSKYEQSLHKNRSFYFDPGLTVAWNYPAGIISLGALNGEGPAWDVLMLMKYLGVGHMVNTLTH